MLPPRPPSAPNIAPPRPSQELARTVLLSVVSIETRAFITNFNLDQLPDGPSIDKNQHITAVFDDLQMNELKDESVYPSFGDAIPPPQDGPSFSVGAFIPPLSQIILTPISTQCI